jgi:recombination protein RecA
MEKKRIPKKLEEQLKELSESPSGAEQILGEEEKSIGDQLTEKSAEVNEFIESAKGPTIIVDTVSKTMSRIARAMVKQYGEKSMLYLKEHPDYTKVKNWISTQNYALDWICSGRADGTGGLPVGRITELFGDPSSGKSLLLTQILSEVQKRGGIAVLYDPETTFEELFATRVGLDINKLMYSKGIKEVDRKKPVMSKDGKIVREMVKIQSPATVERMQEEIETLIDTVYREIPDALLAIGLDSVAALSTDSELAGNAPVASKAGPIRTFVKMLEGKMADRNCIFIPTNHVIANIRIENRWEKKEKIVKEGPREDKSAPGGSGLPFGSSVRLDLTRGYDIREGKILVVGHEIYAYTNKNKVWPAHKAAVVDMYFDRGMDRCSGLLEILVAKEIVEELGDQVFRYKGTRFKRKAQPTPKYIGLSEIVVKYPEILSLANDVV